MLNTVLASVAAVVWSAAYGWFFFTDVRRWWRGRHQRQVRAAAEREQARHAYAAWVRNIPPPPSRVPQLPPPPPPPPLARPATGGVVIPFPRRRTASRR
ncbi:MAG: hypothetical protein M0Z28_15505 [Rhodospirillales bacterium]|nr:hypothetical protein [Rhodospirillales bacterium]